MHAHLVVVVNPFILVVIEFAEFILHLYPVPHYSSCGLATVTSPLIGSKLSKVASFLRRVLGLSVVHCGLVGIG